MKVEFYRHQLGEEELNEVAKVMNSLFLTMIGGTHFATYNQWGELGAQVRKGERGTKITVPMPVKDKVTGEAAGMYWKGATVFSAGQVDGWEAPATEAVDETERNATVDAFAANIGVEVNYSTQGAAFYRPSTDSIQMPHRAQFTATTTSTATTRGTTTTITPLLLPIFLMGTSQTSINSLVLALVSIKKFSLLSMRRASLRRSNKNWRKKRKKKSKSKSLKRHKNCKIRPTKKPN